MGKNNKWLDPNKINKRQQDRYCKFCKQKATQVRILKHENICEDCVQRLKNEKKGKYACKGCGKIAPQQLKENNGYCKDCTCKICGEADPKFVQQHGFCKECFQLIGTNCKRCGKEAEAQVERNNGLCDRCAGR